MKLNISTLAILFTILFYSCKEQENKPVNIKSTSKEIWQPLKMEISGPTINGFVTIVDSSAYLKAFPKLTTNQKDLSPNNFIEVIS